MVKDILKDNIKDRARRIEKLSVAVYRITEFLPDEEPLKWQLRSAAVNMYTDIKKDLSFEAITKEIRDMISLCEIAIEGKIGLEMNFSVIKDEYEDILENNPPIFLRDIKTDITQGHQKDKNKIMSDRTNAILNFIKEHGGATIKDIWRTMPEVSEKTVQRDLVALVTSGTLIKSGKKRWSRYALK